MTATHRTDINDLTLACGPKPIISSAKKAGRPAKTPTATPNGYHHHTSASRESSHHHPANPVRTRRRTTVAPNNEDVAGRIWEC